MSSGVVLPLLVLAFAALAVGIGIVAFFTYMKDERQAELRRKAIIEAGGKGARNTLGLEKSREAVAKKIKELEEINKSKNQLTLSQKLQQTGVSISE
ncbi:MAG: hypothetical protein LBR29_09110, partial [Methylobacteriaceae bacterium]|nr:hypothetical protein [Methylobacteriaceae bacterium]